MSKIKEKEKVTYRDFHPNDIILVYGDIRIVERVDRTHLATRGVNDSLELWSYDGEIKQIKINNKFYMKQLGFYEENGFLKFDTQFGPITLELDYGICVIPYSKDGYEGNKQVQTINDIQQFYYHLTDKELDFGL